MSDAFAKCDLCKKNEAVSLFTLVKGKRKGEPVAVCFKCPIGIPDALLDDFVYSVFGGNSPKLAAMFVTGLTPRVSTDDTFMGGWKNDGEGQFRKLPRIAREAYLEPARKAGVSINGKMYFSEIAAFPGDPRAFVGTKGEAQALLRERNWNCPDLGVKAEAVEPAEAPRLSPDLLYQKVERELADVPQADRTRRMVEDTAEKVLDKHGRKREIVPGMPSKGRRRFRDFVKT